MDTTIRNLDEQAYRALRARAVLEGRTVGEVINEAIRAYLARPTPGTRSLRDWKAIAFRAGNENLSMEIDQVLYGPPGDDRPVED